MDTSAAKRSRIVVAHGAQGDTVANATARGLVVVTVPHSGYATRRPPTSPRRCRSPISHHHDPTAVPVQTTGSVNITSWREHAA